MYKTKILIISNRKELSVKYKKLIDNLNQEAIIEKDLSQALLTIQKQEAEFIVISDTIKENLSDFIKKIRILTYNFRPIIIAISKSNDLEDRLNALEAGADDFLGEEITKQEFQMRLKAHLRRYLESSIDQTTNLFNKAITQKALKRSLEEENRAYILIKIKSIENYRKTHGEIAYEKVFKTLGAIIKSTLSNNDFSGHLEQNEIILITSCFQAEKICAFLVFAFDNILNKFYSEDEFENNFTIQTDDNVLENKDYLMRLYITAAKPQRQKEDYRNIINNLNSLMKICENSPNSTYVIDRFRLEGATVKKEKNILILEYDSALSYLLKNVCEINGIEANIAKNVEDFKEIYEAQKPQVVVLDWGREKTSKSLELAKEISKDEVKLIFSSSYLNKKEILRSGADLYMPKPYEIDEMLYWIKKFLNI